MLETLKETYERVPLAADKHGTVRVAGTRVTLESVVALFEGGARAEGIVQSLPGLQLDDIYAVITYYLRHREEVRAYLESQDRAADEIQQRLAADPRHGEVRKRLLTAKRERGEGKA